MGCSPKTVLGLSSLACRDEHVGQFGLSFEGLRADIVLRVLLALNCQASVALGVTSDLIAV